MSVSIGNPPTAAVLDGESTIRRHMAAASGRIRRLKQIDRLAVAVITLGGLAVVVSVIGILIFIAAEAYPLFRPATGSLQRTFTFGAATAPAGAAVLGTDETGRYIYTVTTGGAIAFFGADTGRLLFERVPAGLSGATMTSSSRSLADDFIAIGTADGRVALLQVQFTPVYTDGTVSDVTVDVVVRAVLIMDAEARPIRRLSYLEEDGRRFVAAQISDVDMAVAWIDDGGAERQAIVQPAGGASITAIDVGRNATLIAGTSHGAVHHWELRETPVLTDVSNVGASAISALEYVIGNRTFIAGTVDGHVSAWFQAPVGADDMLQMVRAADFEPQGSGITAIAASTRDRTFATAGADGSVVLRHQTSGRTLAALPGASAVAHLAMTPRSDGVVVARADATVDQFAIANPHPEVSWHTLFGKVWYEGYPKAEYVWQSTGATDDFEPKISLVPLVFGTIKGTVYALIIAVPLAVLGALYTSQFVHPSLRARIKPTVEIMAALPSVVIGFVAGLYLAPMVERHLVGIMLLAVVVPVFGTSGVLVVRLFPAAARRWLSGGAELLLILPLLVAGAWFAFALAPAIETWFFAGDARQWLSTTLGVTYDQRNSLVVGLAMGFAVIPIIFTISEDAFASVPATLSAASLALGASRWQTAVRVIVPTASPGVFSAVMIGFGRAVGETMIVLMATGNTPVLDWSMFNGFRTLSANIAVEIPEAPHGGSLYRTLFLSASILFAMTFVLNTIAEVIRQRLRQKYRAI